jgi:hypothetical protein
MTLFGKYKPRRFTEQISFRTFSSISFLAKAQQNKDSLKFEKHFFFVPGFGTNKQNKSVTKPPYQGL